MICAKFGWNWPSGSERGDENVKLYRMTGSGMDDKWSEKPTQAESSSELKT